MEPPSKRYIVKLHSFVEKDRHLNQLTLGDYSAITHNWTPDFINAYAGVSILYFHIRCTVWQRGMKARSIRQLLIISGSIMRLTTSRKIYRCSHANQKNSMFTDGCVFYRNPWYFSSETTPLGTCNELTKMIPCLTIRWTTMSVPIRMIRLRELVLTSTYWVSIISGSASHYHSISAMYWC